VVARTLVALGAGLQALGFVLVAVSLLAVSRALESFRQRDARTAPRPLAGKSHFPQVVARGDQQPLEERVGGLEDRVEAMEQQLVTGLAELSKTIREEADRVQSSVVHEERYVAGKLEQLLLAMVGKPFLRWAPTALFLVGLGLSTWGALISDCGRVA
jgi:hypothetical protein